MNKFQQIDFYCKNCKKSMRMSYFPTGNSEVQVMQDMLVKCHTHKCMRVIAFKNYTEGMIVAHTNKYGKYYV